jgi:repressor LexA
MLTKKQLDLLDFINRRLARDGVPPSFDEMKDALNLRSKSGIHRLITALEERGFIRRLAHRARAIEIVKLPDSLGGASRPAALHAIDGDRGTDPREDSAPGAAGVQELPLLGRIAAGRPIEAIDDAPAGIGVPGHMISSRARHYALEVRGDSMIDAGINDGDVVIIRETAHADDGEIVVAQVEGYEATLKRIRHKGDIVLLEAANPAYETRALSAGSVSVQGRLVGLIRTY